MREVLDKVIDNKYEKWTVMTPSYDSVNLFMTVDTSAER